MERLTVKFSVREKSFGKNSISFSASDEIFIQPWIWLSLFDLTFHLSQIGWTRMPECILFETWFPRKPMTFLDRLDLGLNPRHCWMWNLTLTEQERFSIHSVSQIILNFLNDISDIVILIKLDDNVANLCGDDKEVIISTFPLWSNLSLQLHKFLISYLH